MSPITKVRDAPFTQAILFRTTTLTKPHSPTAGVPLVIRSCGVEGFKNTRKGTNIAAQATAITLSQRVLERGIKTVRIQVRGIGPGRMSAIKGVQMAGLNVVSITDNTPVSWNPPRPRKQRRL